MAKRSAYVGSGASRTSIPKMGKCYPIAHFLDFGGISNLYSQPNRLTEQAIKKVSHGSHQSPQSHFAVPTMEGMALGPSPVRTLACLAAHRAAAQKYTRPSTAEGKAARFFRGTKLPFRHGGEEENWAGKAPRGGRGSLRLFGRGNDDVGYGQAARGAARCQAEARCAYDQSRNVVLFQGDRARDSTFDQGFRW